jgi:biotin transporter BioY
LTKLKKYGIIRQKKEREETQMSMVIISVIFTFISIASFGACILGYAIDFRDPVVIVVAICFLIVGALFVQVGISAYKTRIEQKKEEN